MRSGEISTPFRQQTVDRKCGKYASTRIKIDFYKNKWLANLSEFLQQYWMLFVAALKLKESHYNADKRSLMSDFVAGKERSQFQLLNDNLLQQMMQRTCEYRVLALYCERTHFLESSIFERKNVHI